MANVAPGPALTPHFRDFLPPWVARQPWYPGPGIPSLAPVGYLRLEDPDGAVGLETRLVSDGSRVCQVPLTYRGAPLDGAGAALITTAEHSSPPADSAALGLVTGTWHPDGPAGPEAAGLLVVIHRAA